MERYLSMQKSKERKRKTGGGKASVTLTVGSGRGRQEPLVSKAQLFIVHKSLFTIQKTVLERKSQQTELAPTACGSARSTQGSVKGMFGTHWSLDVYCIHTCIHIYIHTCMHAHTHTCIPVYIHICIHAHMHAYTMHTYMHAYMRVCIHTYVYSRRNTVLFLHFLAK